MVAFSGADPIGVLIGAKRPSGTLIHKIAVHPDHQRQGHSRHLLASLASKLAILGPPRMIAEVPKALSPACALFSAAGYVEEAVLTDYVWPGDELQAHELNGRFVIPLTVDDLVANGLREADSQVCWERSIESLEARKEDIAGLAVASQDQIEAALLYVKGDGPSAEIISLGSFVEDGAVQLGQLFSRVRGEGVKAFRYAKVHPSEISNQVMKSLGFHAAGAHRLYAGRARSA